MVLPTRFDPIDACNTKVAALLAKQAGFEGADKNAMTHLADLLGAYLEKLLVSTHMRAELGNHTRPNYVDISKTLDVFGVSIPALERYAQGFYGNQTPAALAMTRSDDTTIEQIPDFLPSDDDDDDEVDDEDADDDDKKGNEGHAGATSYVPAYLPAFPSKHSFRQTPVYIDRPDNQQFVRELNSQQSRTVEENLKRLMAKEAEVMRESERGSKGNAGVDIKSIMPMVNYEVNLQRRKRAKLAKLE
ncbi:hypothetical protein BC940DRAFT_338052 [Gongronella butleri]|nr:hypothetical protein BC940DRAFT_338052 [Gongronella butleri]